MLQISKKFTPFFIVFFIAFSVVLIMHSKSSFFLFEVFTSDKMQFVGENKNAHNIKNVTTNGGTVQNISVHNFKGAYNNVENNTASKVEEKFENGSLISSTNNIEKFLDGLLDSRFDEPSCMSRYHSHLYRKASSHKPSSYLISKLRNYEEIHRRCGPNSKAYHRSMTKILHSKSIKDDAAMCKYLIWKPANGLGNQMVSMVATFLYALLTNRVMLVSFGKDKQGLFCEPFLNSTWLLPENSPFWNENHVETYQSMIEKEKANNNSNLDLPSALFLNLQYQKKIHEKFFHCDDSQALLVRVPLLILRSDQYFAPSLFITPFFNNELEKMFVEKDTVFHHLGRYLFHPSNSAWRLITNIYQKHLAKADEKIGLQIRVYKPTATPQQVIMNLVLNCTLENKLLPKVLDIKSSFSSIGKDRVIKKVVLVASLNPQYGENLKTMYMNKSTTVTGQVIEFFQPSHEEQQKFYDNEHNMKAWVDMYLLSLSDILVTTSLSTFGYVAQGLGNLRPWILYKVVTNKTHYPACEREFSMEPCYHSPPKHFCSGKPIIEFSSSFLYMRECKDYGFGVKLVN
ncbi:fucosyltransferase 2-like [Vicia villosa]|uniref:fucosyltransferase 2-like n=1 Tax=Vicia villosa TaxID=3911 RepID=UPI00273B2661|nr:fucosyltransferase 2-like [Vicia villosa]